MKRHTGIIYWLLFVSSLIWGNEIYINPKNENIPPFRLEEVVTNIKISPDNGIQSFYVRYEIKNENGSIVFSQNKFSSIEDFPEYFITGDSLFTTRIPPFEWNGTDYRGQIVEDGRYILSIHFRNKDNEGVLRDKSGKIVSVIDRFTIYVKTKPTEFYIRTEVNNLEPNKISIYALFNKNETEFIAQAASWYIEIQNNNGDVVTNNEYNAIDYNETLITFPYFEWNSMNQTGEFFVIIVGIDNVFNMYTQRKNLNPIEKSISYSPIPYNPPVNYIPTPQTTAPEILNVTVTPLVNIQMNEPVFTGRIIANEKTAGSTLKIYNIEGILIHINYFEEMDSQDGYNIFEWYGRNNDNDFIINSGEKCRIVLEFEDGSQPVQKITTAGLLYQERDGKAEIIIQDIIFPANQSSFFNNSEILHLNRGTVNTISALFIQNISMIKYITIEGYANPTTWPDNRKMRQEDEKELKPLSTRRADAIKNILVLYGIPVNMLKIDGKGGMDWVVSPNNKELNYKNRRIKFLAEFNEG